MSKKNIVIVGFPKSGTTWVSRLVAELVQCPLIGDWSYENLNPPYKEGANRESKFQCFKSHHTYDEIKKVSSLTIHKIIYIIRDPRDIVVSGVYYFSFSIPYLKFLKKIQAYKVERLSKRIFNRFLSKKEKKRQMIKAVLWGNKNLDYWFKTSWKEHYSMYLNKDILFIRYEDLLDSPENECNKVMHYLQIETSIEHIKDSIEKQSFQKRKQEVLSQNNPSLKKLIRKGSKDYWKKEFTEKELDLFAKKIYSEIYNFQI